MEINLDMITTSFDIPGYNITQSLGIVQGISVVSAGVFGNWRASWQSMASGNVPRFTRLCEETRDAAFKVLIKHAQKLGANAIIGLRFDSNEIGDGITEILAYGTAVIIEKK